MPRAASARTTAAPMPRRPPMTRARVMREENLSRLRRERSRRPCAEGEGDRVGTLHKTAAGRPDQPHLALRAVLSRFAGEDSFAEDQAGVLPTEAERVGDCVRHARL